MKKPLSQLIEEVRTALMETSYLRAKDLAQKFNVKQSRVYRVVRLLREGRLGSCIGVQPTKKGYVLSEFATKTDDVGFLRRLNARRTSDMISIEAARPHIENRWKALPAKNQLMIAMGGLVVSPKTLHKGQALMKELLGAKKVAVKKGA